MKHLLLLALVAASLGLAPLVPPKVLVFSKTAGFRHGSIPAGIVALKELASSGGFTIIATEDADAFTPENLSSFAAVVFLNTTGDVLDDAQQTAFEAFIRGGGGYMGVHAAADTEYDWPFYGELIAGAYFSGHPRVQKACVIVENKAFPATTMLPDTWDRTDEWYRFRASPRKRRGVVVLASLDESTYSGGGMNGDHPIAWYQMVDKGRALYTGGGHTKQAYSEPLFREHLKFGIRWAAGLDKTPPAKATTKKTPTQTEDTKDTK